MAINETISKGNKYRRLKDAANKVWQRISFWTAASDVEFDNGTTLQNSLGSVTGITDSLTSTSSTVAASAAAVASLNSKITSFTGSLSNLYNAFVSKGVTPSAKTLDACTAAVSTLYSSAYSVGYANGIKPITMYLEGSGGEYQISRGDGSVKFTVPSGYTKLYVLITRCTGDRHITVNGVNITDEMGEGSATYNVSSGETYTIQSGGAGGIGCATITLS